MNDGLERFTASVPAELLAAFDRLTAERNYPSRSEALRDAMRDYLVARQWEDSDEDVVGSVTLVYDHEQRMLGSQLTAVQHEHISEVLSTLHIHLDRQNCLEVIVLRGAARDVQHLADHLMNARGVKHGKLVCTTTGSNLK